MLGAIIGDIAGSRFEFNNIFTKEFELLHPDCYFTDDTVMTCAVAKALMECKSDWSELSEKAIRCMREIGREYPSCGYGAKFIYWIFYEPTPYNSKGNGSAMRISAAGWFAKSIDEAKELSAKITAVSHNHPEGMKGAEATAVAVYMAKNGSSKEEIKNCMETNYYKLNQTVDEIRTDYPHNELCEMTVPQALQCFYEGSDFEDVIRNCISIGGDSDTLAAIAGGIAEAYYGIPKEIADKAKTYLDDLLLSIVTDFEQYIKIA